MSLLSELERAKREGAEYRAWFTKAALTEMGIDPDSETGKYVMAEFKPQWSLASGVKYSNVANPEAIFDFLVGLVERTR